MSIITTQDGTQIFYKDWGSGQPVVFSHGWPLNADAWDAQMLFLVQQGFRVIAHDRRAMAARTSRRRATTWTPMPTTWPRYWTRWTCTMPRWWAIPPVAGRWRTTSAAMAPAVSPGPC